MNYKTKLNLKMIEKKCNDSNNHYYVTNMEYAPDINTQYFDHLFQQTN